ncbi:hypothetical protein OGAPHI_005903 [Ogataea philodendri]|uniref:Cleavage/polyadenylation specificity factor A subunit C-terminal domain-containing protein n=1 Tax=Ogataea philodendri TaxID=1378263 RepID=A0A9P8NXS3_9ASCO|nr:uncharacterized protein OGAPHI_005903 [Ogataea philodendri]KAH3661725.1 hypothetical protein OGAPHI_005903 [Ogataea philodendri]
MNTFHQFVDPTTCYGSAYCNFVAPKSHNLVVSKGTVFQLFEIVELEIQDGDDEQSEEQMDPVLGGSESFLDDGLFGGMIQDQRYKLLLVGEYRLNGEIISIHPFKSNENESLDYLIVSTKHAKLSLIRWDSQLHSISTVSLHFYDTALDALTVDKLAKTTVHHRTDPNSLCTCLRLNELFTFLPFYREFLDEEETKEDQGEVKDVKKRKKLFNESFVINAATLHGDIKNIVDYQFLHSYRDPTVAILYAPETLSWAGHLPKAKDNMKVIVLSLDLENRKASTIMEVTNLPYDLDYIHPLPSPTNGFLLVGSNEIIHVNSLGSTRGVYTNQYFPDISNMKLKDHSALNLMLENSRVELVKDDQALVITEAGELFQLNFEKIGGNSTITGLHKIDTKNYKGITANHPIMITRIPDLNLFFVCCQGGDSLLVRISNKSGISNDAQKSNGTQKKSKDDDDWLYDDDEQKKGNSSLISSQFRVMDSILNCGPLVDFTLGRVSTEPKIMGLPNPNYNEDVIVGSCGIGANSCACVYSPTIKPVVKSTLKFSNVDKVWTLANKNGQTKYLITTDFTNFKTEVFQVNKNYKNLYSKDFNNKQYTLQFGTIPTESENKIVQVTPYKVTIFSFKFAEVVALEYDFEINTTLIYGNYIIVIMKTGELDILEFKDDKLEKMDLPALLNYLIFTNGWICESSLLNQTGNGSVKRDHEGVPVDQDDPSKTEVLFWLVTADNRLLVFKKDHKEKVVEFTDIHKFPEYLTLNKMDVNYEADVDPIIKQVMYTKLGNASNSKDYLVTLTFGGEVLIYETFFDPVDSTYKLMKVNEMCQFPIVGAPDNSYAHATKIERYLINVDNFQGYKAVLVTGASAFVILKEHNSLPRLLEFTKRSSLYFSEFNTDKCPNGVISIDETKACRICQLDSDNNFSNRLPITKHKIGDKTINKISYHSISGSYVISTLEEGKYNPVDEDGEPLPGLRDDRTPKATTLRGVVHLVSPANWSIIDTVELEENEMVTSIEVTELKVSETIATKNVVIIGTAICRNEDLATHGSWKIFEIIDIVPEPGRPEVKNRLKLMTSETARGPVLSICSVSGRFAIVQGQRMLVRTLQKDDNVAPVAFTDTSIYSKEVKTFKNMMLIGDSYQSVSLVGFDAVPYRMIPLGKDEQEVDLRAADFLVHDGNLHILVADEYSIFHLLQYDPYDGSSLKGLKLLRRSVFRSNCYATKMISVARDRSLFSMIDTLTNTSDLGYEIIGSNMDGSFFKVIPVNEYQYRRLYSIQNYLYEKELHWLGLNPKSNAIGGLSELMPSIKRPFIELNMFHRFVNLNDDKKRQVMQKLGKNSYVEVYKDIISLQ